MFDKIEENKFASDISKAIYNENTKVGEFNPPKEISRKVLKDRLCDPMI